ncbi:MAG: OmpA family protein [Chitinophagaceae bacterium]
MSSIVPDEIKNTLDPELAGKSAQFLGESETGIQKAWSAIVPAIWSGIINKANSAYGKQEVFAMAIRHAESENKPVDKIFITKNSVTEDTTLQSVFGNQLGQLVSVVSSYSTIKTSSVETLMNYGGAETFTQLGKYTREHNLDANGLYAYLNNQKSPVMNIIPAGLDLSPVFGNVVEEVPGIEHGRGSHATDSTVKHKRPAMKMATWLTPLVLLTVIAVAALYFTSNAYKNPVNSHATTTTEHNGYLNQETATAHGINDSTKLTSHNLMGSLDSTGNFIYNTGAPIPINLGTGGTGIQAGPNSTETKLVNFLNDQNAGIDSAKGNWFEFTGVSFKPGSSELTSTSISQLKNFAIIAKAYPKAKFKIGGYTDDRDDLKINTVISEQRAKAVLEKLKELGVSLNQLAGSEGYGPLHPISDNATDEGRARNRRVAVNVKAK